jgi:hypothetical protein
MDPQYYNTVQDLSHRNDREGKLLLVGFDSKLSYTILSAMREGKLTKRDIVIVDDFKEEANWQDAFDFSNEVKNKIKKHGEYIKQEDLDINKVDTSGVFFTIVALNTDRTLSTYKPLITKVDDNSCIHLRDHAAANSKHILDAIPDKYSKSKTLATPTNEVTIVKSLSEVQKVATPSRTRSDNF